MKTLDCVIIGGGSAGLAAAIELKEQGIHDILLLEKDAELGGILNQCIHNGFGLHRFKTEMAGPAYAEAFIRRFMELAIPYRTSAAVTHLSADKVVTYIHPQDGITEIQAKTVILAMGARERTRGNIALAGDRCVGVWTAGNAQKYLNMEGYLVGRKIFILGSGDIGLIMARRLTLSGAEVVGVAELMPYSNGLTRNLVQCLQDYEIPLYLSTTITAIHGRTRVESITLCQVDEHRNPIPETAWNVDVDTVLLSVGLIPDQELGLKMGLELDPVTRGPKVDQDFATNIPGVYACGNALHIHDVVDYVSEEGEQAAQAALRYLNTRIPDTKRYPVVAGTGVSYVLPQSATAGQAVQFKLRVKQPVKNAKVVFRSGSEILLSFPKDRLNPSEMEVFRLPQGILSKVSDGLSVEVEPL